MTNGKNQRKKKNVRVDPKKFPFGQVNVTETIKAIEYLTKWRKGIDDRLFNEDYELRNGVLYELGGTTSIDAATYWKKRKEKGLRS